MVIEPQAAARHVGHVGQHVVRSDFDQPVLQVLRMDELVFIDDTGFDEQDGADEAVEIGSGQQTHSAFSVQWLPVDARTPRIEGFFCFGGIGATLTGVFAGMESAGDGRRPME